MRNISKRIAAGMLAAGLLSACSQTDFRQPRGDEIDGDLPSPSRILLKGTCEVVDGGNNLFVVARGAVDSSGWTEKLVPSVDRQGNRVVSLYGQPPAGPVACVMTPFTVSVAILVDPTAAATTSAVVFQDSTGDHAVRLTTGRLP